jgi:glycolate oxidase FAD binding subunit
MNQLPSGPATVLRLEGLPESVAVRQQTLVDAMSTFGPVTRLEAMQTGVLWSEIRDVLPFTFALDKPLWRVSVAPMAGHQLLSALRLETGVDAYFDWQGGLLWLQMEAGAEADLVRRYIQHVGGGHATLIRANAKDRATTAAFEPQTPAIVALSQRIKSKFDPKGIFNPGRMGV